MSDNEVWDKSHRLAHAKKHAVFQANLRLNGELDGYGRSERIGRGGLLRLGHDYGAQPYNKPNNGHVHSSSLGLGPVANRQHAGKRSREIEAAPCERCKVLKNKVAEV
jgi:hypothetical protein